MAHDIPELCKFLILDHCQRRLLCTHKEVDLVRYPFVCHVLQVGDAEKFPQVVSLESLDSFFRISKQGPCLRAIDKDGSDKRLLQKADGFASPDPA